MAAKAYFMVIVTEEYLQNDREVVLEDLKAIPEVKSAERVSGTCDLMLKIEAPASNWMVFTANKLLAKEWVKHLLRAAQGTLDHKPVHVVGELIGQRCIGQSFVARRDNLYRIDVLLSTYGRRNTRDVILHLKELSSTPQDLATVRINASLLADNSYARFVFNPQQESQGKSYYFFLESPESIPGDAVTLWGYSHVDLPPARLYRNERPSDGQLVFGAFYLDDQFSEVGERPLLHRWARPTIHWRRLEKAYRLLLSQGLRGLWQEVIRYWKWKTDRT